MTFINFVSSSRNLCSCICNFFLFPVCIIRCTSVRPRVSSFNFAISAYVCRISLRTSQFLGYVTVNSYCTQNILWAKTFFNRSVLSSFITLVAQFTALTLSSLRGISLSVKYSTGLLVTLHWLPKLALCRLLMCAMSLSTTLDICTLGLLAFKWRNGGGCPCKVSAYSHSP